MLVIAILDDNERILLAPIVHILAVVHFDNLHDASHRRLFGIAIGIKRKS